MKPSSDLTAMYRSFPAYLWVEDEETRTYLETAWDGESRIKVYVADGHVHLQAVVHAAQNDGYAHVFGFRDRDFGASNRSRWRDQSVTVLAGDSLELENLLLDGAAIAACEVNTARLDAARIEQELLRLATPLTWWMSCRRTITEIRDTVTEDFLSHPARGSITSQHDAETAILESKWWVDVLPSLHRTWGTAAIVSSRLVAHETAFRATLASGEWKKEWSGKEILREVASRVWTRKRPPDPAGRIEFVRAVARAQRQQNRIPAEVSDLRAALLFRIGH